ncbi:hypothetical protein [Singulisphaera sp. PoT]|uniref:hypothetical protein n=1 Tax=Singulisphaera sp. PoT TaxID=3411797 RepID=UPI003BF501A5
MAEAIGNVAATRVAMGRRRRLAEDRIRWEVKQAFSGALEVDYARKVEDLERQGLTDVAMVSGMFPHVLNEWGMDRRISVCRRAGTRSWSMPWMRP